MRFAVQNKSQWEITVAKFFKKKESEQTKPKKKQLANNLLANGDIMKQCEWTEETEYSTYIIQRKSIARLNNKKCQVFFFCFPVNLLLVVFPPISSWLLAKIYNETGHVCKNNDLFRMRKNKTVPVQKYSVIPLRNCARAHYTFKAKWKRLIFQCYLKKHT